MQTQCTDLTVFARDYPEARLVLEVKSQLSSPPQEDPAVEQLVRYMWGANCHYGIIMTPTTTFILRDEFTGPGPESIRLTDTLPTQKLLSRVRSPLGKSLSAPQLEHLAREWLERCGLILRRRIARRSRGGASPLSRHRRRRGGGAGRRQRQPHDSGPRLCGNELSVRRVPDAQQTAPRCARA